MPTLSRCREEILNHHPPRQVERSGDGAVSLCRCRGDPGVVSLLSCRLPSMKVTPAQTSATSSAPAISRQRARAELSSSWAIARAALRDIAPRVTFVRSRTDENVDSIGFVVPRCTQCP